MAELVTSAEVVAGMVGMVQVDDEDEDHHHGHRHHLIIFFKGELFCNMEGHWWDVEQCQAEWAWFLPEVVFILIIYNPSLVSIGRNDDTISSYLIVEEYND